MGRIYKDDAKSISRKLNRIKSDFSSFRSNILAMKKKFDERNNSDRVIDIIEKLINQHSKTNG